MKKSLLPVLVFILVALLAIPLAACAAKPSASNIQTAVAATLAAAPAQPGQQVTQLVEVTRVVEVTAAAQDTTAASDTPTDTPEVTDTPTATEAGTETVTPTETETPTQGVQPGAPLYWSLQYFVSRYSFMTDLQKQQFVATLPGRTVSWYAIMDNVTSDGLVMMRFPFGMYGSIVLEGVPADVSAQINRGYQVEFTGTIQSFDSQSSNQLVLANVKITAFYPEPTATVTLTATPVTPTPRP
jgi:hypothetical protein